MEREIYVTWSDGGIPYASRPPAANIAKILRGVFSQNIACNVNNPPYEPEPGFADVTKAVYVIIR